MKIETPNVTLADEARSGVEEDVRSSFLDWLFQFSVTGDDGESYSIGGSILSMALEKPDAVSFTCARGQGHVGNATTWGVTYRVPDIRWQR